MNKFIVISLILASTSINATSTSAPMFGFRDENEPGVNAVVRFGTESPILLSRFVRPIARHAPAKAPAKAAANPVQPTVPVIPVVPIIPEPVMPLPFDIVDAYAPPSPFVSLQKASAVNFINTARLSSLRTYFVTDSHQDNEAWVQPFGQSTQLVGRGLKAKTSGMVLGIDSRITHGTFLGASIGYSQSKLHWNDDGKVSIKNYLGTLYGTWYTPEGFYVDGSVTFGPAHYYVGDWFSHQDYEVTPHLGTGLSIKMPNVTFEPYVGADLIVINGKNNLFLRSEVGSSLYRTIQLGGVYYTGKIRVSYLNKSPIKVPFSIKTRHQLSPGVGLSCQFMKNAFLRVGYDLEIGGGAETHQVNAKVGVVF